MKNLGGEKMEFKKNSLKEKIKGGGIALGTAMYSFSPAIMEVAGFTGLDFCRIDNEHAWRQDEGTENVIRGALLSGIVPLLRVDRDNPFLVRKALEAGAGGVIVPHVHDRKDAEEIVQAAKFPPFGKRGYGGLCLSGQWGVNGGTEWMEWSNAETLVIPMIEDISAMAHIDAILSTEGVDAVLFGPADFSLSLGLPLQTGHEKVIGEAADKHGKFVIYPGAGFPQWETVHMAKELGVKAIELGHDVTILRAVWAKTIQAMKKCV
jgi:2-keto-3-deoxy-L-rhamnonate aldolase RhmA